jgi:hypothetical protein
MRAFIYKVLLFVLIVFCIDFFTGFLFSNLYQKAKSGIAFKENYIFNKSNEELLIYGSSRAEHHYVSEIIENETSLTTYNLGRQGAGIFFHYSVFLATLERYKPKVVVLELDYRDVYFRSNNFGPDALKEAAPFYGKINKEFDSLLVRNNYDYFLYQSNLYKYNKKFFNIITGVLRDEKKFNGYSPLKGTLDSKPVEHEEENSEFNKDLLDITEAFILKAKKNKVKLIISLSPSYKKMPKEFDNYINLLSTKYDIKVLNHFKDTAYLNHPKYFKDFDHLNDEGARLFSKEIGKEISVILKNK